MNPLLIKIGVGIIASAATLLILFLSKRRIEQPQYEWMFADNYSDGDPTSTHTCCICLDDLNVSNKRKIFTLPCKHKLHRECLKQLFASQSRNNRHCPYCRRHISDSLVSQCQ